MERILGGPAIRRGWKPAPPAGSSGDVTSAAAAHRYNGEDPRPMHVAERIRKLGLSRWYERQLIEAHAYTESLMR